MKKENMLRRVFLLTQAHIDMVVKIQEKQGMGTFVEALRYCILSTHSSEFKDYILVQKQRSSMPQVSKEVAKLEAQEVREQEKERRDNEKLMNICLSMGEAKIINDENTGKLICHYPVFTGVQGGVEKCFVNEPLSMMNDETPLLQHHDILGNTGELGKENNLKRISERGLINK
jgi:hypothetical protein